MTDRLNIPTIIQGMEQFTKETANPEDKLTVEDYIREQAQEGFNLFEFEPGNIAHLTMIREILQDMLQMTNDEITDHQ